MIPILPQRRQTLHHGDFTKATIESAELIAGKQTVGTVRRNAP